MKILQLNTRSLNTSKYLLKNYIHNESFDIVCLTETWHKDDNGNMRNTLGLIPEWKDRTHKTKGGGVAVLVGPHIAAVRRKDLESEHLEAIFIEIKINNKRCILASIYLPPERTETHKINLISDILGKIKTDSLLITGDFNARSLEWEPSTSTAKNSVSWTRGIAIEELNIEHNLQICNLKDYTRTFHGHNSSPDLTLKRGISGQVKWYVDKNAYLCTDHNPIIITIQEEEFKIKTRLDLAKADWVSWRNKIEDKTTTLCNNLDNLSSDEAAESFNLILTETAKETKSPTED